jgi:hypothetical protein
MTFFYFFICAQQADISQKYLSGPLHKISDLQSNITLAGKFNFRV